MAFKEVFRSLRELFPQVDLRILKAVAIEHSKDVHAAVEFILYEVLPALSRAQEAANDPHDTRGIEESHPAEGSVPVANENAPAEDHSSSDNVNSSGMRTYENLLLGCVTEHDKHDVVRHHHEIAEVNVIARSGMEHGMPHLLHCASDASHLKSGATSDAIPSKTHCDDDDVQLFSHGEPEETSLVKDAAQSCQVLLESGSSVVDDQAQERFNLDTNIIVSIDNSVHNFPSAIVERNPDSLECDTRLNSSLDRYLNQLEATNAHCPFTFACDSSSVAEQGLDPMRCIAMINKDVTSCVSECEEQQSTYARENSAELFVQTDMVSVEAHNQHTAVAARSAQVVNADVLEEFVIDAKNNKKLLMSAKDSVFDLMKDVELNEERAKQANYAASLAGQDTLEKVEELKQMLKHAKEANEMHAGEVYGERSILATEARELQSRLLSLSDERDKSLTIIEEVRQILEERLVVAKKELEAFEQEKLEKEELAGKALKEQELIMEIIVQESKKLQQEADENSKLREFLMDRGRIVDTLQGEIVVICEDVRSLKHMVDNRIPLNRSISSNGSLASSLSSSHHKSVSSNEASHPAEFAESPGKNKQDHHIGQQLSGSAHIETESNLNIHKIADDDWEVFDETDRANGWLVM